MRMLILGGTEFLGHTVASVALAREHQVVCLARGSHRRPPAGAEFVRADRGAGPDAYAGLGGEWDAVLELSWDPRRVGDAVGVLGRRGQHWTFVSSTSVYADQVTVGQDETAPLVAALRSGQAVDRDHYGQAKVAAEQVVVEGLADRAHVVRPGLVAGAMDTSDRFGYWVGRFARDKDDVLIPDVRSYAQVIGVGDLAAWIVTAAENRLTGTHNAVGDPVRVGEVLRLAREVTTAKADMVAAAPDWLSEMNVSFWAGPESLPLWLPQEYTGFATRSNDAATAAGLTQRPLRELMTEVLAYEKQLGLRRDRKAGLSASRELALIQLWRGRDASL